MKSSGEQSNLALAAGLTMLPISCQLIIGIMALVSCWNILVFMKSIAISFLQIVSGVLFLPTVYLVWKAIFKEDTGDHGGEEEDDIPKRGDKAAFFSTSLLILINVLTVLGCMGIMSYLFLSRSLGEDLKCIVRQYHSNIEMKKLIDDIQMQMRCCGGTDVTNWFYHDWQNTDIEPGHKVDLSTTGWDAVPFSCCSKEAKPPCRHIGIKGFGLTSLYSRGCDTVLNSVTDTFLVTCAILSLAALFPLIYLAKQLKPKKDTGNEDDEYMGRPSDPKRKKMGENRKSSHRTSEIPENEGIENSSEPEKDENVDDQKSVGSVKDTTARKARNKPKWHDSSSFDEISLSSTASDIGIMPLPGDRGDYLQSPSATPSSHIMELTTFTSYPKYY